MGQLDMSKLKTGDIILYRGRTWLARQILKWLDMARRGLHLRKRQLFNHVSVVVDIWGHPHVVEAIAKGVVMRPVEQSIKSSFVKVKRFKEPLTIKEKNKFSKAAIEIATSHTGYNYFNFLWHILRIKFGKWFGLKGPKSQRRLYCSELAAVVMDKVRGTFKGHTWDKSPLDIDLCPELVDIM